MAERLSRRDNLSALIDHDVDELGALQQLAAFHKGSRGDQAPLRDSEVKAGAHVFPASQAVPTLLAITLGVARDLFAESQSESDDLLVATWAMYMVTAIHPFADKNGQVAVDFGQYLLMRRWDEKVPPLFTAGDTHAVLGGALAPLDADVPDDDFAGQLHGLFERLDTATLPELWTEYNLVAAAHALASATKMEFESRLPAAS